MVIILVMEVVVSRGCDAVVWQCLFCALQMVFSVQCAVSVGECVVLHVWC